LGRGRGGRPGGPAREGRAVAYRVRHGRRRPPGRADPRHRPERARRRPPPRPDPGPSCLCPPVSPGVPRALPGGRPPPPPGPAPPAQAAWDLRAAADVAMAEGEGGVAFDLLLASAQRAADAGDDSAQAAALAYAATIADRFAGNFLVEMPHERLRQLVGEAARI